MKVSVGLRGVPLARAEALVAEARRRALAYLEASRNVRIGGRPSPDDGSRSVPPPATNIDER